MRICSLMICVALSLILVSCKSSSDYQQQVELLHSSDEDVRRNAAYALGEYGGESKALAILLDRFLLEDSSLVKAAIAHSILQIMDEEYRVELTRLKDDPSEPEDIREMAATLLKHIPYFEKIKLAPEDLNEYLIRLLKGLDEYKAQ